MGANLRFLLQSARAVRINREGKLCPTKSSMADSDTFCKPIDRAEGAGRVVSAVQPVRRGGAGQSQSL